MTQLPHIPPSATPEERDEAWAIYRLSALKRAVEAGQLSNGPLAVQSLQKLSQAQHDALDTIHIKAIAAILFTPNEQSKALNEIIQLTAPFVHSR